MRFQSLLFWNSVCEKVFCFIHGFNCNVSILVVLEFGLWVIDWFFRFNTTNSFNPCCSGIRSVRSGWYPSMPDMDCFNPCCSGIRSVSHSLISPIAGLPLFQSLLFWNSVCEPILLIYCYSIDWFQSLLFWNSVCEQRTYLVGMEMYCFNPCCSGIRSVRTPLSVVNIVVAGFQSLLFWNSVCEIYEGRLNNSHPWSFNPCCSGIRSVRLSSVCPCCKLFDVSILVVLEFGLWVKLKSSGTSVGTVSILVVLKFGLWVSYFNELLACLAFQSLLFWNSVCEY